MIRPSPPPPFFVPSPYPPPLPHHHQQEDDSSSMIRPSERYLLFKHLVGSMAHMSYRVFQKVVEGIDEELVLQIAQYPKLFKRLTVRVGGGVLGRGSLLHTSSS